MSEYDNGDLVNPDFDKELQRQRQTVRDPNKYTLTKDRGGNLFGITQTIPATDGTTEQKVIIPELEFNLTIDQIIKNPNTFPLAVALAGFGLSYYLAMHPDVMKETIRAVGGIVPDTLSTEVDVA